MSTFRRKVDPVTRLECMGAFAAKDVYKPPDELTRIINLGRESEQQVAKEAVEAQLNVMRSLKPPLVKVKAEAGRTLYAYIGPGEEAVPQNSARQETVPSEFQKTPKRLTVAEREQQFQEKIAEQVKHSTDAMNAEVGERLDGALKAMHESFQKTLDAQQGMEREKMEVQTTKAVEDLEKKLDEKTKAVIDLQSKADRVPDLEKKLAELAPKATALDELQKVMPRLTPDNLRERQGNWQKAEDSAAKARRSTWVLSIVLVLLLVAIGGYAVWQQRGGAASASEERKPVVEAPVEEDADETDDEEEKDPPVDTVDAEEEESLKEKTFEDFARDMGLEVEEETN